MAKKRKTKAVEATGTVIDSSKYDYETIKTVDKHGKTRSSTGNGDAIQRAMLLFAASGKDINQVIRANKLPQVADQYDNKGLLRMSVGNSLRAIVKGGGEVTIGDIVVKKLDQKVVVPEGVKAPAKVKSAKKAAATRARRNGQGQPAETQSEAASDTVQ